MVIQRTVNPPPLARLVRSQYSPPKKQEALCLSNSRPVKINVSGSLLIYPSVEAKLTPDLPF